MDKTNAERQRRYIERLKQKADAPHGPDMVLAAIAKLRPVHFLNGQVEAFAERLIAEAARLSPVTNMSPDLGRGVSNGSLARELEAALAAAQKRIAELEAALHAPKRELDTRAATRTAQQPKAEATGPRRPPFKFDPGWRKTFEKLLTATDLPGHDEIAALHTTLIDLDARRAPLDKATFRRGSACCTPIASPMIAQPMRVTANCLIVSAIGSVASVSRSRSMPRV